MRCLLPLLVLSLLPAAVQAGTVQLSPASLSVDNTKHSQDVTLTYTPSAGARDLEVSVSIGVERLGWSKVEAAAPPAGVTVLCALSGGQVRALVWATSGGGLPTTPLELCRMRVRPHLHSPSQAWYSMATANAFETDVAFNQSTLANVWSWVWVP